MREVVELAHNKDNRWCIGTQKVEERSADGWEIWGRSRYLISSSQGGLGKAEQRTVKTERRSAQPESPSHGLHRPSLFLQMATALDHSVSSILCFALQFLIRL